MTQRKRLEGALADWHPHPKEHNSLVPVVRDAGAPDDIADRFFEAAPAMATPEPSIALEPDPRADAVDSASVRARRRYLMRYVAGAVSVAGVIGLAAIVRVTVAREARAADGSSPVTYALAASLPIAGRPEASSLAPADPIVAPDPAPAADRPLGANPSLAAEAPIAADPPAVDSQGAVDPTAGSAPVADDSPPDSQSAAAARKARNESQRALDRGHVTASIEAGEQSVALDPTDADAWLILGAAYQKNGRYAAARRCFASCAQQARHGARWECRALLKPDRP